MGREFLTGQKLIPFKLAEHHQFINREVAVEKKEGCDHGFHSHIPVVISEPLAAAVLFPAAVLAVFR